MMTRSRFGAAPRKMSNALLWVALAATTLTVMPGSLRAQEPTPPGSEPTPPGSTPEPTPPGAEAKPGSQGSQAGPLERGDKLGALSWRDIVTVPRRPILKYHRIELIPTYNVSLNNSTIRHHTFSG